MMRDNAINHNMKDKLDCIVKVHLVRLHNQHLEHHRSCYESRMMRDNAINHNMKDKLDCIVKVHLVRLHMAAPSPGHHRHMQVDTTSANDVRCSARETRTKRKIAPPSEDENHTQVDTTSNNDIMRRSARRTQQPIRYFDDSDDGDDSDDSDYSDDRDDGDCSDDSVDRDDRDGRDGRDDRDDSEPKRKRKGKAMKGGTGSTKSHGAPLSEYELERLENIRQNKAFLSALNLPQWAGMLKRKCVRREKVVREAIPPRKSSRLENTDADVPESKEEEDMAAPVPMCPLNVEDGSSLPEDLVRLWTEEPVKDKRKWNEKKINLKSYKEGLQKMTIQENRVAKVVHQHVFSAAFHPCDSSLLMAAGDYFGTVGIWNPEASWGDDGVLIFSPHTKQISCMKFSKSQPSTLITASCDETVRVGDVERATFDEVYRFEDLRSFDFLSDDCTTLLLGNKRGCVTICDMRTQKSSHESFYAVDSSSKKIMRCVHVHPVHRTYFLAAGLSGVRIYDVRYLNKESNQAVSDLGGPRANSAYFSPDTGNRVLATGNDDTIRVFDTSQMISSPPLMTSIREKTEAKGSATVQAVWDPKQEDCFAVGSSGSLPCIKVFHERGELLHSFEIPDGMATSVCSVVAFHPSRFALLGGNSYSRLHVFT